MLIDAHLHCSGLESSGDVLRALDEAQVDVGVLLAPFLSEGYSLDDAASLRRANACLSQLVCGHADRLVGFAVVDPRDPAAAHDLRHAVETLGLRGVKLLEVLGPGLLQFGSDCFLPCPGAQIAERHGWAVDLLHELGLDAAGLQRIWSGTAAAWLGLPSTDKRLVGVGMPASGGGGGGGRATGWLQRANPIGRVCC